MLFRSDVGRSIRPSLARKKGRRGSYPDHEYHPLGKGTLLGVSSSSTPSQMLDGSVVARPLCVCSPTISVNKMAVTPPQAGGTQLNPVGGTAEGPREHALSRASKAVKQDIQEQGPGRAKI